MWIKNVYAAGAASIVLAGCVPQPGMQGRQETSCSIVLGPKTAIGAIGGAAAGTAIGAAISHGNNGALIGGLLGAVAGGAVGSALDADDCEKAKTAMHKMSTAKTGQAITWNNPTSGNSGSFTPLSDPVQQNGRICRQYRTDLTLKNSQGSQENVGTVCRNPQGDWDIMS